MPGRSWLMFLGVIETAGVAVIVFGVVALANPEWASSWIDSLAARMQRPTVAAAPPPVMHSGGPTIATRWKPM